VLRGTAGTRGMAYEIMAEVRTRPTGRVSCSNGVLTVVNAQESVIYWTGATEYDITKGTASSGYSFKGRNPHGVVSTRIRSALSDSYSGFYKAHITDVKTTLQRFTLDIGQQPDYRYTTDQLVEAYTQGRRNVLLEWLLFQYGRYLLFSSARGTVPSNLQGVWAKDSSPAWSGGTCVCHLHLRVCTYQ
jgi:alpha-L-fucosidase 2